MPGSALAQRLRLDAQLSMLLLPPGPQITLASLASLGWHTTTAHTHSMSSLRPLPLRASIITGYAAPRAPDLLVLGFATESRAAMVCASLLCGMQDRKWTAISACPLMTTAIKP